MDFRGVLPLPTDRTEGKIRRKPRDLPAFSARKGLPGTKKPEFPPLGTPAAGFLLVSGKFRAPGSRSRGLLRRLVKINNFRVLFLKL